MKTQSLFIVFSQAALYLTSSSFGFAAEPQVLTWAQCVEQTAAHNPELQAARESLSAAYDQISVSRSGFFPQISGSLSYSHRTDSSVSTDTTTYIAGVSASENLFSGLQDLAKVHQSEAQARQSQANYDQVRAQIGHDLKVAYVGLQYSKNSIQLAEDVLKRRTEDLGLVRLRFQSGRENKGSVLLSQAYLSQAKYDLLLAEHSLRTARAQLAKVLGIDDFMTLDIGGDVPMDALLPSPPDLKVIGQTSPTYRQAAAQTDSADASVTLARAGFFPSLNLTANWQDQDTRFFPNGGHSWTLGANLTIPIFSGGRDYYSTQAASANFRASAATTANVARDVIEKLENTYAAWVESDSKLQVDADFSAAAKMRAEIGRTQYNTGLINFNDWDTIENDLIARNKSYLQSKRDRVVAEAEWELAQGKGVLK